MNKIIKPAKFGATSFESNGIVWSIYQHVVMALPENFDKISRPEIFGFDLDGTIISTKSGRPFAVSSGDWKWNNKFVVQKLRELTEDNNNIVVIFTNQGGTIATRDSKSFKKFRSKYESIIAELKKSNVDTNKVLLYMAPKKPAKSTLSSSLFEKMRKPQIGLWKELEKLFDADLTLNIYVGDAAGRKGDFSDSDKKFAENLNCDFKTPEEFFTTEVSMNI